MRSSSSRRQQRVKNLCVCRTDQTKDCCAVSLQNGARKLFKIVTVHVTCYLDFLVWVFFVQSVNYPLKKASFLLCRASGVLPGTRGHQAEDERQTCGYRVERLPVTQKVLCCVLIQGFVRVQLTLWGFSPVGFACCSFLVR